MKPALALSLAALLLSAAPAQAGTRLSRAAVDGDLKLVQDRVSAGENVNDVDRWGWSALTWAAYYGHHSIVKFLLEKGADPNFRTTLEYGNFKPGVTPVILAAYYGYEPILKELLAYKVDTKVRDIRGKCALDYAKDYGFNSCVALLQAYEAAAPAPAPAPVPAPAPAPAPAAPAPDAQPGK